MWDHYFQGWQLDFHVVTRILTNGKQLQDEDHLQIEKGKVENKIKSHKQSTWKGKC